jgi:hypothetical protein
MRCAMPEAGPAAQTRRRAATACLALWLSACAPHTAPPDKLDLALKRPTEGGRYLVELLPPDTAPRVNRMHTWRVSLHTRTGQPVVQAIVAVDGGMPQHGHGLPTQPRVSATPEPGLYVLEGMKFSMTGWWEIRLHVRGPEGEDRVTFNTVLPESAN